MLLLLVTVVAEVVAAVVAVVAGYTLVASTAWEESKKQKTCLVDRGDGQEKLKTGINLGLLASEALALRAGEEGWC